MDRRRPGHHLQLLTRTAPQGGAESGVVTAHAELTALTAAGPSADLAGATVYAGGEPCPMCSAALVWAGVARIVFAAGEADFAAIIGGHPRFALGCAEVVGAGDAEIAVSGPHLEEEALVPFRRYAETVGAATSFTSLPIPPSGDPR